MASSASTQNIYDTDPAFYARFVELREARPETQQAGVPDMAALHELLPALAGKRVLDLGCGDGWFSRWASARGAAVCRGVDVSAAQLDRARQLTDMHRAYLVESRGSEGADVDYVRADLNQKGALTAALATAAPEKKKFQVAFSSLSLHYVADLRALLDEVAACLAPGAFFFFSIEHPLATAPTARTPALVRDGEGKPAWPVRDYAAEGARVKTWLEADVLKQHRTVASYLNAVVGSGFDVVRVYEWGVKDGGEGGVDQLLRDRNYGVTESVFPYFMGFKVWKR
ncbi:S-adenosyl-L-methionine-dependent methyltransferase [Apiospora kogelbergensis]|uniref:S-adenosyl-L-methionine-dependent methyltransferase n=1 Tax=Apiospora kogelbergensis TaxID=1337665 RepID=A0AAW0QEM6_9PEZI